MDLIAVLLTGLLAGGVSCAAVQGGLLAGMISFEIGSSFASDASVAMLFKHPTIAELAEALDGGAMDNSRSQIPQAALTSEQKVNFQCK